MKLETLFWYACLLVLSLFHAWRHSKTSADPDWAYFNLYAFSGSLYGRDFPDCKTPGVHLYYWLLSRLAGVNVRRIKFVNHFLVGSAGLLIYALTGNFYNALSYTVLVNSGWLLAFHGNVGQVPAALIAVAFSLPYPLVSFALWLIAVFYEPKLILSFGILYWKSIPFLALIGILLVVLFRDRQWFQWLWESSITIPARMAKARDFETWFPWFTSNPSLYLLPWLLLAVYFRPDFLYWLPAALYVSTLAVGRAIRSNHLIPLIPWIVFSGIPPVFVMSLSTVDFISSGFYFGDLWLRYYPALAHINEEARTVGEWLRDKPGSLYVNGIQSAIYLYARKPVPLGMAEQIEIREAAHERRAQMQANWRKSPPDWVVCGEVPGIQFKPIGYDRAAVIGENVIYLKGVRYG